jgi:hypothetical protein
VIVEQLAYSADFVELDQQDRQTLTSRQTRQRGAHSRLAYTSLASNDHNGAFSAKDSCGVCLHMHS